MFSVGVRGILWVLALVLLVGRALVEPTEIVSVSVYSMIEKIRTLRHNQHDFEEVVKKELIGEILITHYNSRETYRIDDINFEINPDMTFSTRDGTMKKYTEYYFEKHGIPIEKEQMNQPALISHPRKRHINKGQTTDSHLFPSLCHPTGLTDDMRKNIGMEEVGRNFYDRHSSIKFPEDRLELWPGIKTAIRRHDVGKLMCVEVIHKVLRKESVYEMIQKIRTTKRNQHDFEKAVKKELIGVIVITHYNRKTYRIDDIDFNINPGMTFSTQDGTQKKYTEYYFEKHGIPINKEHMNQPALISHPRKRDINKGQTTDIHLFPSLCHPIGLTDDMRKNFGLMKRLSDHIHIGPSQRYQALKQFVAKVRSTQEVTDELEKCNVNFDLTDNSFVTGEARELPYEAVYFGPRGSKPDAGDVKADWTRQLKGREMLEIADLQEWIIFCPERDASCVPNLVLELKQQANKLGMASRDPLVTIPYPGGRSPAQHIRNELKHRKIVKFALIILSNNNVSAYAEMKKICTLDFAIGNQCFLAKNMNKVDDKEKMKMGSICSKVMIQINAKLRGVPWGIKIPVNEDSPYFQLVSNIPHNYVLKYVANSISDQDPENSEQDLSEIPFLEEYTPHSEELFTPAASSDEEDSDWEVEKKILNSTTPRGDDQENGVCDNLQENSSSRGRDETTKKKTIFFHCPPND